LNSKITALLNFYIYSSLHISIAATLFSIEIFYIFNLAIDWVFVGIVFSSTLFIYSIHRIIGIRKMKHFNEEGRFKVIKTFKSHILFYAGISLVFLIFFLLQSSWSFILFLIPVGLISILYTLPIFPDSLRLRDFNFIKIFLIAFVWAYLGIWICINASDPISFGILTAIFLERFFYIIAITLPFDIRDIEIDKSINVKTIANALELKRSYILIGGLLIASLICWILISTGLQIMNFSVLVCIVLSIFLTWVAIHISKKKKSDYYYSGLLDGVIILRSLIVIGGLAYF